jgi:hypothetical protein
VKSSLTLRGRLYHWTASCAYCVPLRSGVGERGHNRIVRFRQGVAGIGLVLLVSGTLGSQRTAFSQESSQQAITRKIKAKVDPRYPELARQYQLKGKVKIETTVSPDGSVKKTRVVGGSPLPQTPHAANCCSHLQTQHLRFCGRQKIQFEADPPRRSRVPFQ